MIRHGFAAANELKLHYVASGPEDGHLVLFLHGFPEYWRTWRHQLENLGDTLHCVAPDLPGYGLSSKPVDVARYRTKRLIADVAAFAAQFSKRRKFTLVAHDWGGALAWAFAIRHPELLDRLIIINAVHPGAFQREIAKNPEQAGASQYIHEIRAEGSEFRYAKDNFALLWRSLEKTAAAGHLTTADREEFTQAWSEPGALTGMFNWYRAMKLEPPKAGASSPESEQANLYDDEALTVRVPTRVLWGMQDTALLPGCIEGLERWVPDLEVQRVSNGTHWIVYEQPELVTESIKRWLAGK